ncbi:MAG: nucleoside phosphorylase [Eubacteriales bacterium]|nr:nucleoside phosphorylase [Eubacteriales bacterium]
MSEGGKAVLLPHIQLPEDLGIPYAILPGDPARVERVAAHLEQVEELAFNREYRSVRGEYHGVPVLVMSTGMGGPSTAIAVEELRRAGVTAAIRIGSAGALQPGIMLGDLVLVQGAVREEGTSLGYAPLSYPAIPDLGLLEACIAGAKVLDVPYHVGIDRTHDCLYADGEQRLDEEWSARGVAAADMETAVLFVVGAQRGVRTASILNVVAGYRDDVGVSIGRYASGEEAAADGERREILTALEALRIIAADEQ